MSIQPKGKIFHPLCDEGNQPKSFDTGRLACIVFANQKGMLGELYGVVLEAPKILQF